MTNKLPTNDDKVPEMRWMNQSQDLSLDRYLNHGNLFSGFGPFQAFVRYTHRLFTTVARLPFAEPEQADKNVEKTADLSLYRNFSSRIV